MISLEVVLRAIASLIVVVGLILWLGKRFNGDGSGALASRLGTQGSAKKRVKVRAPKFSQMFSQSFARRGGKTNELISVVGRQALVGHTSIAVVDVDGQRLVLGVTDSAVSVLHSRVIEPEAVPELATEMAEVSAPLQATPQDDFARELNQAVQSTAVQSAAVQDTAVQDTAVLNSAVLSTAVLNTAAADIASSKNAQPENAQFEGAQPDAVPADTAPRANTAAPALPSTSYSRMDGSILSPNTWRQAKAAMKVARVGGSKTTRSSQHWS